MDEDHQRILRKLANLDAINQRSTVLHLSKHCDMSIGDLRSALRSLQREGYVQLSAPGLSAAVAITWSGKEAVKASFAGGRAINIRGGSVQIGQHNRQQFLTEESDDDDDDDDDSDE